MKNWKKIVLGMILLVALTACASGQSDQATVVVEDVWIPSSPMVTGTGAAYMQIKNEASVVDELVAVRTDVATVVEFHETKEVEGKMKMSHVESIEVPANGQIALKPGHSHLMLIGLTRQLAVGEEVSLTLIFKNAGEIQVTAQIRQQ